MNDAQKRELKKTVELIDTVNAQLIGTIGDERTFLLEQMARLNDRVTELVPDPSSRKCTATVGPTA